MTDEMDGYEISQVTTSRDLKCRDVGKSGIVVKNYSVNWWLMRAFYSQSLHS
jgi:hypothetical protein